MKIQQNNNFDRTAKHAKFHNEQTYFHFRPQPTILVLYV